MAEIIVVSRIEIRVTAEDIKRGIRGNVDRCPVALAARLRLKTTCRVDDGDLLVDEGGIWMHSHELSDRVWSWVVDFDTKKRVRPIRFQVQGNV